MDTEPKTTAEIHAEICVSAERQLAYYELRAHFVHREVVRGRMPEARLKEIQTKLKEQLRWLEFLQDMKPKKF